MAVIGQPQILTHRDSDKIIRLFGFNLTDGFIQTATTGGGATNNGETDNDPYMGWRNDGGKVFLNKKVGNTFNIGQYDSNLTPETVINMNSVPTIYWDIARRSNSLIAYKSQFTSGYLASTVNDSFVTDNLSPGPFSQDSDSNGPIRFHPHELYLFVGSRFLHGNDFSTLWKRTAKATNGRGAYTSVLTLTDIAAPVVSAAWLNLGQYLMVATTNNKVRVYELDTTTDKLILTDKFTINCDGIRFIRSRSDGRYVALSYVTGGVYTTNLYKREGGRLLLVNVFNNMGRCLDFSADGGYLLDCNARTLYEWNPATDQYEDNSVLMINIPTLITAQTMSPHQPEPVSNGYLYKKAFKALVEHDPATLPLDNLKMMLLSEKAEFRAFDTVVDDTYEVFGFGWNQGGLKVSNVQYTSFGDGEKYGKVTADTLSHGITRPRTYRYATLYNADNKLPVAFYDFGVPVTAPAPITLSFDFDTFGIVSLEP